MVESINATTPLDQARQTLAAAYDLKFTKAVEKVTERVYGKLKTRIPEGDWATMAPLIVQINRVKREKNTVILADIHQSPAIYWSAADRTGDDLQILRDAAKLRLSTIVVAGVQAMAENIKLLLPRKRVLIPDSRITCRLATSITREDVEAIRAQYPGVTVLVHVNASLAVKAAADATVTAANALEVVEAMPGDRVIMVPDQYLAQNVAQRTTKKIIAWAGFSQAFGGYTTDDIASLREAHADARILAHPQNRPAVVAAADFSGPTKALADWLTTEKPARAIILGDGAVADNLAAGAPQTEIIAAANGAAVPERRVTLEALLWSLHTLTEEVSVAPDLATPARAALQRMLEISPGS